ncbi:predicted protein [Sclerotinia sclerotiorum 1980 UF-70]|nr:predicted protein [Sclerotinia sclerotiorum 1980 UF-70]EDN97226.1 predicted protein [Sclerotinia sclerotiorum 1980 UF-70]
MLYLFLAQGGQVYFVKLPPPSPGNSIFTFPTTPSFSSTLPIRQNTSKRGRDSRKGFRSSCRKLNTVDTNDYVPDFTPLTSIDVTPNNDSSPGFSRQQVPSKKHVTIEFGDAVSVCLNLDKPPGGRREPVETAGYPFPVLDGESLQKLIAHEKSQKSAISSTISSTASNVSSMFSPSVETTPNRPLHALVPTRPLAPEPLLLPHSTCFIRCDPDQGIRICILPEIMENSEITWIDLPGIWIHTTKQKLPEGAFVMGFADWIYSEQWISALYQEVLINESLRGCEQDYAKSGHVWEASGIVSGYKDAYMESTSDLEGNTKSVRRTIQYPSGDDLGVNWSASEAENTRTKLANKREISVKWEREVRESTWPWYLWRQFGLSRGWIKEPEEFGDRMRNKDDVEGLRRIITHGCSPVGYEDMDEALDGESIADFRTWWRIRHKCFGGPKWEGL